MKRFVLVGGCAVALTIARSALLAQAPGGAAVYEGARLIIGDGRPPIENGAFVVQNGRITAVGRRARSRCPPAPRTSISPARR